MFVAVVGIVSVASQSDDNQDLGNDLLELREKRSASPEPSPIAAPDPNPQRFGTFRGGFGRGGRIGGGRFRGRGFGGRGFRGRGFGGRGFRGRGFGRR